MPDPKRLVPAANFCSTLEANLDNDKLSDAEFRQFVRNSLPGVQYPTLAETKARRQG